MIGIGYDVAPLLAKLAEFQPKLVFSGCEGFRKNARHEYAVAALLDMYGYRYTGSSPTALLVARNKSLTKKILAYQDRKSTRLNSSHSQISYAVFCLKKKK